MLPALLLVHHDAVMRSLLIRAVQACGVPVLCVQQAGSAEEARRVMHATGIDVMLLDATSPESGANDLLVRSTHADADFPSVVVMCQDPEAFRASVLGATAVVVATPCAPGDLRIAILDALRKRTLSSVR